MEIIKLDKIVFAVYLISFLMGAVTYGVYKLGITNNIVIALHAFGFSVFCLFFVFREYTKIRKELIKNEKHNR